MLYHWRSLQYYTIPFTVSTSAVHADLGCMAWHQHRSTKKLAHAGWRGPGSPNDVLPAKGQWPSKWQMIANDRSTNFQACDLSQVRSDSQVRSEQFGYNLGEQRRLVHSTSDRLVHGRLGANDVLRSRPLATTTNSLTCGRIYGCLFHRSQRAQSVVWVTWVTERTFACRMRVKNEITVMCENTTWKNYLQQKVLFSLLMTALIGTHICLCGNPKCYLRQQRSIQCGKEKKKNTGDHS